MKQKNVISQGDVFLTPCKIPKEALEQPLDARGAVLAEGEVTGHSHRFPTEAKIFKYEDKMYVRVQDKLATLIHDEHEAYSDIPCGDYEIGIQQKYDYLTGLKSKVLD